MAIHPEDLVELKEWAGPKGSHTRESNAWARGVVGNLISYVEGRLKRDHELDLQYPGDAAPAPLGLEERDKRETLLREIGAIEGMGRVAETLRDHLEDSIQTILDTGFVPVADPLGRARDLVNDLADVLSILIDETT